MMSRSARLSVATLRSRSACFGVLGFLRHGGGVGERLCDSIPSLPLVPNPLKAGCTRDRQRPRV